MVECQECKFWIKWGPNKPALLGNCHKHAPHPTTPKVGSQLAALKDLAEDGHIYAFWPTTKANMYCGEGEPTPYPVTPSTKTATKDLVTKNCRKISERPR